METCWISVVARFDSIGFPGDDVVAPPPEVDLLTRIRIVKSAVTGNNLLTSTGTYAHSRMDRSPHQGIGTMNMTTSESSFASTFNHLRSLAWRRSRALGSLSLFILSAASWTASIPVPNASFESPDIVFASSQMDSWQRFPGSDQATGLFDNTPVGASDHIDNADGAQVGFLFAAAGVGIYQDLTTTYQVGMSYDLTIGIIGGGGGMPAGQTFEISLFYRDNLNAIVPIGTAPVVFNTVNFPTTTHLVDYTVQLSDVQAGDAWAGKNIGVQLLSTSGTGAGDYWDVDNVRLTAVPEPATVSLLVIGVGGLLWAHRRRRA